MKMHDPFSRLKFFDRLASEWDQKISLEELQQLSRIFYIDIPELKPPILDVGCGTGNLIPFLRSKTKCDAPIIELDISRRMLRIANQKTKNQDSTFFLQANVQSLPFSDKAFGSIICFSAFPHFQDKLKALKEMYRCLTDCGYLIVLHLTGHRELNRIHKDRGLAVINDRLPAAKTLASTMVKLGFSINIVRECSTEYLIIAQK